jgi:hypothetical protein
MVQERSSIGQNWRKLSKYCQNFQKWLKAVESRQEFIEHEHG